MEIHWRRFEKFILHVGCHFVRKKGDHRIYWREGLTRPVVFPEERAIRDMIIATNLRTLGMDRREFLDILRNL
ncbi:MAG: type II toxin-antitoxin system HicA family toxin [Elusimicrobia bacterium]|nr:type II toxin-antitoxin system HicA family toxin [Elusimicrobiota bacterium]